MANFIPPIKVEGASENNLKSVNLELLPGTLVVFTGLSGAGKSTLLFDVLHAEGQRKYVETFSPYVRQFLETLKKPNVKSIKNVRPSIAVEQKNTVKNSRSTVGTMTELCDYFKVWFSQVAKFVDPESEEILIYETCESLTNKVIGLKNKTLIIGFWAQKPCSLSPKEFISFLIKAGHSRGFFKKKYFLLENIIEQNWEEQEIFIVVDRISPSVKYKSRINEAISLSIKQGHGMGEVRDANGEKKLLLYEGIRSPVSGKKYCTANPSTFSFNSPIGACPDCKGFGRIIKINPDSVVPDKSLSIEDGAVKPFSGKVYGYCKEDLLKACKKQGIPTDLPWNRLSEEITNFIWKGDSNYQDDKSNWYGIESFFNWLDKKTYKMHVRVFLSKYRDYFLCDKCKGHRLKKESNFWKWHSMSLPELYQLSIDDLLKKLKEFELSGNPKSDLAIENIITRLGYLQDVGLGYLSLNRASKSLSGGETQRVNLTACLGASLTDTLFALDEPTIGLHGTDIKKLVSILRALADAGNCVCIVEHDEQIIKSADKVYEIGPLPGTKGGEISFQGSVEELLKSKDSVTGKWISKNRVNYFLKKKTYTNLKNSPHLTVKSASKYNIQRLSVKLPLTGMVCIAGVSGSGKSTLVHDIIYKGLQNRGKKSNVTSDIDFEEIVLIDQSSVVRTPRSNPVLYTDAWNPIKEAFGRTESAKKLGFVSSDFSFNTGNGRCSVCGGLGYESVEMQFLSDIQIPCTECDGKRFNSELLSVKLDGLNILETLNLTVDSAIERFKNLPKTFRKLSSLKDVGLGYLTLGQPLNTLSGGESQRLKLVKYMSVIKKGGAPSLIIIDEPTTGLHLEDIEHLMLSLRAILDNGHSLIMIEHHDHVIAQSDWVCEMGPGAGKNGGKIIAEGPPQKIALLKTPTARILKTAKPKIFKTKSKKSVREINEICKLKIKGARENNLKNFTLEIPKGKFVVVTGPSGSGKSSLAFQVIFAEGQRRFMESMSSYARQFIQQVGKPEIDSISGISPTVAIEQRGHKGNKKSTVGSITEIAQFLRLLYARIGIQLSIHNGRPLSNANKGQIYSELQNDLFTKEPSFKYPFLLFAPLVTNRKGHHKPIVNWALEKGYNFVRCDGNIIKIEDFVGLERYKLHNIEVLLTTWDEFPAEKSLMNWIKKALEIGNGRFLISSKNESFLKWYSTERVDSETGESYPELEPSSLSWNSSRGWCMTCRGYGRIYDWMKDDLPAKGKWWQMEDGEICSDCDGQRLNSIGRNVVIKSSNGKAFSLPDILKLTPPEVILFFKNIKLNKRSMSVANAIIPEVIERLSFMNNVGLNYLSLDRETSSLSGGEAQRIRLASQLGSNLSGVLYILDEPSIGLHPKDNNKLIESLRNLQTKGNSLLVVEHDPETISQADYLIDIGPGAGEHGGEIIVSGKPKDIMKSNLSETAKYLKEGMTHPIRGKWREIPKKKEPWIKLNRINFRNLKNISVEIPSTRLCVCCGVSGSGKSSLVRGFLYKAVKEAINQKSKKIKLTSGNLINGNIFGKVVEVTQSPIGKTPRSTPATYLGVWDRIRTMISSLPEAKAKGFLPSHFSFNVKGGRCELCKGAGRIKVEMNFLPNSYIECSECNGKRYREEILNLNWHSKNISEILNLTFDQAAEFFHFDHFLHETFSIMVETGLGYIKLGQISPTLSGGEAQRLKLASELSKGIDKHKYKKLGRAKPTLFILEEPTIGLHTADCRKLILLLHKLVDENNTVIVIEHDSDLIAEADYLIELGPEGGDQGGELIYSGSVTQILSNPQSPTAPFLKKVLSRE